VHCPFCKNPDSRVIDSRTAEDGTAIRRRRSCTECGRRFTTQESVILMVAKRSGVTEPFSRDKIIRGVRRACQGRPVDEDQLAILAQRAEDTIRARGCAEIASHEVGLAILGPLRELDEVAYLRFASVYRGFESLADFEEEIAVLREAAQGRVLQQQATSRAGTSMANGGGSAALSSSESNAAEEPADGEAGTGVAGTGVAGTGVAGTGVAGTGVAGTTERGKAERPDLVDATVRAR
jgi:transcriptional repressor NrdR